MGEVGFKITSKSSLASIVKVVRKYKDFLIADIKSITTIDPRRKHE